MESELEVGCCSYLPRPRKEVAKFASEMERVLALPKNEAKGGWKNDTSSFFMGKLYEEVDELAAILADRRAGRGYSPDDLRKEAADVANIAMMIADNWGDLFGE